MNRDKLTVPQKLLLAALEVRKRSPTFSAEDLVVEAWKQFPDTFGLSSYASQYPDSNRVLTNIMGTKGMRGKGWLRKIGEKQYRLTSAALSDGEALNAALMGETDDDSSAILRAELDRVAAAALDRILSTPAARKGLTKQVEAISFNDACGFWDITVRSNANTLQSRLADVTALLDRTLRALGSAKTVDGLKIGGTIVTRYQVETLINLHSQLQEKFKSELDYIRKRTDERMEKRLRAF
jgi:hypothetical protein